MRMTHTDFIIVFISQSEGGEWDGENEGWPQLHLQYTTSSETIQL